MTNIQIIIGGSQSTNLYFISAIHELENAFYITAVEKSLKFLAINRKTVKTKRQTNSLAVADSRKLVGKAHTDGLDGYGCFLTPRTPTIQQV